MLQRNEITIEMIQDWEYDNGESFFDYAEYVDPIKLLQFISEKYSDEYEQWKYAVDDYKYLCSIVENVYPNITDDETSYCKALEIVCDYINSNPELLEQYNEFLEEYDTEE